MTGAADLGYMRTYMYRTQDALCTLKLDVRNPLREIFSQPHSGARNVALALEITTMLIGRNPGVVIAVVRFFVHPSLCTGESTPNTRSTPCVLV